MIAKKGDEKLQLEAQLNESQIKNDEQARQMQDLLVAKNKFQSENNDFNRYTLDFFFFKQINIFCGQKF